MNNLNSPFNNTNRPLLTLAAGSQGDVLLPEQGALFDLGLRNNGTAPVEVLDLDLNDTTPELFLYDGAGKLLVKLTPETRTRRAHGHVQLRPGPRQTTVIQPGGELKSPINLWKYTDPLSPGRYALQVSHDQTRSSMVPFEIVTADVAHVANGYNAMGCPLFAWLATPRGIKGDSKVLFRLSTAGHPSLVMAGGFSFGTASPRARLAVSGLPYGPQDQSDGWLAVVSEQAVELTHQKLAAADWKSGPIKLEAQDIRPVPRFPGRGHAVFLATGAGPAGKPLLLGVRVEAGRPEPEPVKAAPPQPVISPADGPELPSQPAEKPTSSPVPAPVSWRLPLQHLPLRAECAFGVDGAIRLLLVSQQGEEFIFSRLDVSETGVAESPERVVGRSTLKLLATALDKTNPEQPAFQVLLGDRKRNDLLALARIPLEGEMNVPTPEVVRGWPILKAKVPEGTKEIPRETGEVSLEISSDGRPWIAFTDNRGSFHGGPLRGPGVALLREAGDGKLCLAPRVVVSLNSTELCCFTETGNLFHAGGSGGH